MAFKYIAQPKESDVTLSDVLSATTEITGTSYYNESSVKQYVYVKNAPLTKFLAKDVFQKSINPDPDTYVNLDDIDKNFKLQKTKVSDVLYYTVPFVPEGQTATGRIVCDYTNVRKDTFPHALVAEVTGTDSDVNDQNAGMRFLIAIPSTRDNDKSEWEPKNFINLFTLSDGATFHPAINYGNGQSSENNGNVIITFNDKVKVAIADVTDDNGNITVNGNTILSDGRNLTVVCTDDLYTNILENGIKSIKLEIVDNRNVTPVEMEPGEGFVGK